LSIDRGDWLERTLGPLGNDALLQSIAERLNLFARHHNIVARLNNSQFAILLSAIGQQQEAGDIAQRILKLLSLPLNINSQELFLTASIGIAFYPEDGLDFNHLLKHALTAMYHAQSQGGNRYQLYTRSLPADSTRVLILESAVYRALERQEFQIYYQPKIDGKTLTICGAEALIRWQHSTEGMISPAEFIPIAEQTGAILPIGEWVMREVCQQIDCWQKAGYAVPIAVNLSGRQFDHPNLSHKIACILAEFDLEPQWFELELTESILVENPEMAISVLCSLKDLGIKIAVDDFGMGYSSLSYLKKFPFDILKIDQSFVRNLGNDPKNLVITTTLIQLAHRLQLKVVAEGVETEAELSFLRQHNCDAYQGYFFSPPLSAESFEQLLRQGSSNIKTRRNVTA